MAVYGTAEYGTDTYGAESSSGGGGVGGGGGMPDLLVEVAFDTLPPFTPIWTDISDYVRSFSIRRGRQRELDRMQAGICTMVLDNQDRRFDPTYASGPYYPNVKPMRKIRVQAMWDDVTYPVFQGYVESWPQQWAANGREAHVEITASDGFAVLGLAKLNTTYPQQASHERVRSVLDDAQWGSGQATTVLGYVGYAELGQTTWLGPVGDRAIGGGNTTVQESTVNNISALDHLQTVTDTEHGLLFVARNGALTFYGRQARLGSPFNASQATFGDSTGELPYADLVLDQAPVWNEVIIQRVGGTAQTAEDTDSQLTYFKRTYQRNDLLHISDSDALSTANWILSHCSEPTMRISSITFYPRRNADELWPQVLQREIGDRVTIIRRPPGGGDPIEQESHIEGVSHMVAPKQWVTQWWLSAAEGVTDYLIIGDPFTGLIGTGRIGF